MLTVQLKGHDVLNKTGLSVLYHVIYSTNYKNKTEYRNNACCTVYRIKESNYQFYIHHVILYIYLYLKLLYYIIQI